MSGGVSSKRSRRERRIFRITRLDEAGLCVEETEPVPDSGTVSIARGILL